MTEIRRIKNREINQALSVLFQENPAGRSGSVGGVLAFKDLARRENYDLSLQIVVTRKDQVQYSCIFVPNQGGSAFIFTSNPAYLDEVDKESATIALRKLGQWATEENCNILQILLEIDDASRREICLRSGFRQMTDLVYLYRYVEEPLPVKPALADVSWQQYDDAHHELFKDVIARTYQASQDCPELEKLRDMEEVVLSHQTAGRFDSRWWKIVLLDNQPAGVLLMSPLYQGDTMELTYMGLMPQYRFKGLGKVLLNEALLCAGKFGAGAITLAVDQRNHPARKLYDSFGFKEIFRRTVMFYSSRW